MFDKAKPKPTCPHTTSMLRFEHIVCANCGADLRAAVLSAKQVAIANQPQQLTVTFDQAKLAQIPPPEGWQ